MRSDSTVRSGWRAGVLAMLASYAAAALSCDAAPVENKACECAAPYICCRSQNVCLAPGEVCVDAGGWPTPVTTQHPQSMDGYTVFAASQVDLGARDEEQLFALKPDLVLRGWSQWSKYGIAPADYTQVPGFQYVQECHAAGITFLGGVSASAIFRDQFPSDDPSNPANNPTFNAYATVNAAGHQVSHDDPTKGLYRGTLANPKFRDYLVGIAQIQIAGGVDGINFDEVNEGYEGLDYTGNEGFDKYNLADFNAFLLAKYPGADFRKMFDLPSDNYLRADRAAGDLTGNFDYSRYLAMNADVLADPFGGVKLPPSRVATPHNRLAVEWGGTTSDRPVPGATSFVDQAVAYHYWSDIVDKVRRGAGRPILISAKGIYPFVDFQSVALNDYAPECPLDTPKCFLPLTDDGQLAGTLSLQAAFRTLKDTSDQLAPGVPVVLYLDGLWRDYDALSDQQRADYWRIYAAEAYANGLFYAFRLSTTYADKYKPDPPKTAAQGNVLPPMVQLAKFYRWNAALYHGFTQAPDVAAQVTTSLAPESVMIAVSDQAGASSRTRAIHLVNHAYDGALIERDDITVTIPIDGPVTSVRLVSPDLNPPDATAQVAIDVTPTDRGSAGGHITVTVPSLVAYDVLVVSY